MDSNHITLVILLVVTIRSGMGAYDCGSSNMNIQMNRIQKRLIPILNPVTIKTIQLLQVADFSEVHVTQCKVEIRKSIYHCDMHSHISIVSNGDMEYVVYHTTLVNVPMKLTHIKYEKNFIAKLNQIHRQLDRSHLLVK